MAKQSQNANLMGNAVGRLVKRTGADTMLKNALRDGAEFAWVPAGDTCAFCITLASRGWQRASKAAIKGGHAEHIHSNCDCTYAIRFDGKSNVAGYDPDQYLRMYEGAEGDTWQEKVNSMRRAQYAENREKINAQKRAAYAARKERETGLTTNHNRDIVSLPGIISLEDEIVGRSLGAKAREYDIMDLETGEHFTLAAGIKLANVEVFAGKGVKKEYKKAERYAEKYGGKPEDWQHVKGTGTVDYYGEYRDAELHWSQCEGIGKEEFFIKRWLE